MDANELCTQGEKHYNAKDYKNAFEYFRKAAEQRFAEAQYLLGNCYEYGRGVPQDIAKAIEKYEKAAEQGNNSAKQALARLKK